MPVSRISRRSLEQILGGKVGERHDVVIKFYGQNCHLCHGLRDKFVQISDEYENIFFYAFNMDDGKGLEKKYGFEGVPSICHVRTGTRPKIHFLEEPKKPHKETWYHPTGIRMFIDKYRSKDD